MADWNWPPQDISLGVRIILAWLLSKTGDRKETLKSRIYLPFVKRHLHLQTKSPSVKLSPCLYHEEGGMTLSLETLNQCGRQ